jgi:DNA-binding XRE family transcriptional regulator
VAQRAGISRTSLYKVEAGDAGATLGTYLRVLAVLGLEGDISHLAADDKVGRKLQDLALMPQPTTAVRSRVPSVALQARESFAPVPKASKARPR